MGLADADRTRLIRLLGMLGSAFDGERANAAALADKLVRAAGMTWSDVVSGVQQRGHYTPPPPPTSIAGKVDFIFKAKVHLTDWEVTFLSDLRSRSKLSEKQLRIFNELLARSGWEDGE